MNIDATLIANRGTDAMAPVTTAIYTVQFIMNEEDPDPDARHIERFAQEIQRILDETDFSILLRYDAIEFEVVARTVIATTHPDTEDSSGCDFEPSPDPNWMNP